MYNLVVTSVNNLSKGEMNVILAMHKDHKDYYLECRGKVFGSSRKNFYQNSFKDSDQNYLVHSHILCRLKRRKKHI